MDESNLATIFAPTIMHSRESKDDPTIFLSEIGFSTNILLHLIKKQSLALASTARRRSVSDAAAMAYATNLSGSNHSTLSR